MKFCSFLTDQGTRFGFELETDRLVDLSAAGRTLVNGGQLKDAAGLLESPDLKSWLCGGKAGLEMAARIREQLTRDPEGAGEVIYSRKSVRLLAPIPSPGKVICIGLNYRDHAEEQNVPPPKEPLIFAKFPNTVIGPEDEIRLPAISQKVDPEAELCIVVLERGKGFQGESARRAIAGYMVGNDVSARDLQFSDRQWVRGKSCDTFAPCGPFLVTEDELGDPHDLDICLRVNGETRQHSSTSNLIFDCYALISYVSQAITLEPGDVVFTGTPAGVGVFRDPQIFLKPGDLVEVTIQGIGTLKNPVRSG